jgi:dTDP-4-dehydrorhamnose 3,5-epimerase
MSGPRVLPTRLDGLVLLEPVVHGDARGAFHEAFREDAWERVGVREAWVQDNQSRSVRGVVRGLHVALGRGQAKLVRCARGRVWDVAVDLRTDSPTYRQWEAHELDDVACRQLYLPVGFAHGFCVLSDVADVVYKVSSYYDPAVERAIRYDDPELAIPWPADVEHVVSRRDAEAPSLREAEAELHAGV